MMIIELISGEEYMSLDWLFVLISFSILITEFGYLSRKTLLKRR
ncbi:hypothetical protein ES702_06485 [subsurface metagenome]